MSDRETIIAIRTAVNDSGALPVAATLDFLAPEPPAASVQQLPGVKWGKRYITDGGTRQFPYAVLLRVKPRDTATRADGYAALMALDGVAGDMTELPSLVERSAEGGEVWRASFVLESQEA